MPLSLPSLSDGLETLAADPPATAAQCAQTWADAVQAYATGIVPPSATVAAAAATLASALVAPFGSSDAAAGMEGAFSAFAVTVGGGMAGYTAIPPPAPVGFSTQFAGAKPATHKEAGQQIGALIDGWMRTGTATLIAPPYTVLPWS